MSITLAETLDLVGRLDDTPGDDTPRERFRRRLHAKVPEVGQVRDYIEECLRTPGDQHNRALQDLVNHLGHFLGFEVTFGRYQGVHGQVGFDGHWVSPSTSFHLVVEVKTTDTYAIKTATLVGYVDDLISDKIIPSWEQALGLYVLGRADVGTSQIENAIVAEKRTDRLRVISTESLLSLAELAATYDVAHGDVLSVLRPSGPAVDPVVDLMARLVAQRQAEDESSDVVDVPPVVEPQPDIPTTSTLVAYWLTPVKSDENSSAEDVVRALVGKAHVYAFGEKTPGRKRLKPGDWICFYATGVGVVGHARVATAAERRAHPDVRHPDQYPWVFGVDGEVLYPDSPVVVDPEIRAQLDAFRGKDATNAWSWFVQATHELSEHDFLALTRRSEDTKT